MQFPESWLRSMVNPALTTRELGHLLTMSGFEVESCDPVAPPFSKVVVGQVRAAERHPGADRLTVCQVDAGTGKPLTIVCGAPNVVPGMKAPCALVGARLPGAGPGKPFQIELSSMRGIESQGMLCSARELGLSDDHSGLLALDPGAPVGRDVREYLALDDQIFTIKLTPNRADCLSVLGVAREVAALTGAPLSPPVVALVPNSSEAIFPVRISDPQGCGRFTGRVIQEVDPRASTPQWMRQRLERAGQRCISALVDVTNYVMLELGRPLHVYDVDKLAGCIDVRWGRPGERLKLLNEQIVALEPDVLAIADATGPIGLAGIMGGDSTKADLGSRHVFLEAAFFFPDAIAGRARRFNFASDASHRFERGVDFNNNVAGIERATQLILEICGGKAGPTVDTIAALPERKPVRMRVARAQRIIGVAISAEEMEATFDRLQLALRRSGSGTDQAFWVGPPSYRFDLEIEEDLIEEVARVHGFENIPAHPPLAAAVMRSEPETQRSVHALRAAVAATDYQEVINFSFVEPEWEADFAANPNPIRLVNPIANHLSVMRTTLFGGLVANLRYNLNRRASRVRLFEVGRVYLRESELPEGPLDVAGIRQPVRIAAAAYGPALQEQWGAPRRSVDFFDVKGDLQALLGQREARYEPAPHPALHPGRSARVVLEGYPIGWIGELHPRWQQKYELPAPPILFEVDAAPLQHAPLPMYREVAKFPVVSRDLSVIVPETVAIQAILDDLAAHKPGSVESVQLFDLYRGQGVENGKKSLAFRVLLQDTQKTMTDSEVDSAVAQLLERLVRQFGAKLRD
ncbi:MAG TPA: phenylalanine--tRNA ligase subunit beta [Burkholderiales bacterium]|nr:phenylalanine--tRNA ligase subunit beta [Burkholderiales bacterium]